MTTERQAGAKTTERRAGAMTTGPAEFVSLVLHPEDRGIGTIMLSRPPTNALTRQVYRELAAVAAEAAGRPDIEVVIVSGGHEIFSAGDDVPEWRTFNDAETAAATAVRARALEAVATIPKPTVAAISGYALGSGLALALAADWRVAGDNVKVGASETLAGLVPDRTGLQRLAETVGRAQAKDMVFSGRFVDATEANGLGLFDEMVDPDGVYDAACARARRFLGASAATVAASKAIIDGRSH